MAISNKRYDFMKFSLPGPFYKFFVFAFTGTLKASQKHYHFWANKNIM